MVEQKKYLLFLGVPDSEFAKKTYGGYHNVFVSLLGDEGEQWDSYRVVDGEFPDEKDLEKYDGFVISGSSHDAFQDTDWILKLCDIIKKLDEMKKKVLGVCFGHQLIARVKGGKVGRARKGPELCLGNITILKDAVAPENYFGEEVPTSLRIIKCHQDEVLELPESAKLLAYSSMYEVEMYSIEDNFLCIQGHPEYNRDILIDILDRVLAGGHITEDFVKTSKATLENNEADRQFWQKICKNFLKATCDSTFVKKTYGGYFNVFVSTFGEEGEQWDLFRVIDGEFPEEKDLDKYDGFIISGSLHDAFGDDDWIIKLCSICQKLDDMKKKVLGICFGHQILNRIKGGKIGRARRGADMGLRTITIAKDSVKPGGYFGDKTPNSLAIIKCHQDEVWELPESATLLAYSDKYNQDLADKAKATMEEAEPDRKQWQTLCKNFLKGKTDQI
ncbi:hypothetical protein IGI04_038217 [Brassica rapa subsp. trilocularis]|uniref:Glutamine amidotransferase domain-containing protein n=1 Tax=Brassica rapa subsp. trilocularis TaxID=1813537 RepID=A0ABQ7LJL3_BRACM|nr:hypothetical protein IGI04_038217 [Brassica rapa subsp. trilocularis]